MQNDPLFIKSKNIDYAFQSVVVNGTMFLDFKNTILLKKLNKRQLLNKEEIDLFEYLYEIKYNENAYKILIQNYCKLIGTYDNLSTIKSSRWYKFIFPKDDYKRKLLYLSLRRKAYCNKPLKLINIEYSIQDTIEAMLSAQALLICNKPKNIYEYRKQCEFSLGPASLPKIDGYSNLCKYGWYSKNNILGMTKDHKLSIKDGYENNISPYYMSHPANCEFMGLRKNSSKSSHSSLTFEELKKRISKF